MLFFMVLFWVGLFLSPIWAPLVGRCLIDGAMRSYRWRSVDPDAPTQEDLRRRGYR